MTTGDLRRDLINPKIKNPNEKVERVAIKNKLEKELRS
jgi:hypothetical protein